MNRRRARAAHLGSALLTAVLTSPLLLPAGPALASNEQLGPSEGADLSSGLSLVETIVLFVLVPAAILLVVASAVWLPGMVKADRYRPAKGWSAPPVWFSGPPDPLAAVETTERGTEGRGGARGSW